MAETVLSMTRSTLSGAVKIAASAAAAEMGLLIGVRKDIWFIKDELETMQAFLEVAEAMKKKDVLLKVWAKQVRDLSYNIEDCLGEFMVHVGSQSLSQRLMKLKDRHRIAMQIRDLKSRVEEVSVRNTRYSLIKMEPSSPSGEMDSYVEDVRNHSASNIDEAELVGFSKRKEKLIELMDVNSKNGIAKVICVVGMGGLGKTTLAMKTYESKEDIVKNFSCCAWITVSQTFLKIEMLKGMIMQLLGDGALEQFLSEHKGKTVGVDDFATYLRGKLEEKRYLVVLDDLWNIEDWKWIESIALPSSNNKGSRIIVTTRDAGLASQVSVISLIYHLKALKEVDAKDLLLRKTMKTQKEIGSDKNLKELVEQLVKKCGGLPLAILTIGGILANKKITEWRDIYNQLPSEIDSNTSLDTMRRMVTLSYNHLPSHLKSCFLYLSIFPEDFEIDRKRLVERWMAEGFVREKGGVNIEDVGKSYFNELINRSMIIPSRVNIEGSVKSCRVHDIMRDVMVSISRDENFVYLAGGNMARVAEENFRHVAFHGSKYQNIGMDWSHVRSLTVFSERPMKPTPSLCSPQLRMLRVLDLQDTQFKVTQKDIKNIGLLLHLRYVNVQGCATIYELPRSIGKLQGLESLCITGSHITTLPIEISKLKSLRSIRCSSEVGYENSGLNNTLFCMMATVCCMPIVLTYIINFGHQREDVISELHDEWSIRRSWSGGVRVPRGIGNLKVLQTLEVVDIRRTSNRAIKELGELVQLRKLRVTTFGATKKKCKIVSAAVEKLSSLCSLCVDATMDGKFVGALEWVHSISSPSPLLRSLKLFGYLGEMPNWVGSLMHLVKISLQGSLLEDDKIMEILGALPNLMLLRLYRAAYIGEKLVFRAGAFPSLRKLHIGKPHILISDVPREVRFEKDASPRMERIQITACRLESGIVGIRHLPRLKGISLSKGSRVAKLGVLQGEVDAHPNNPVLRLARDQSHHDLGGIVEATDLEVEAETGERSQVVISTTNVSEEINVEVEATEETSAVGGNSQEVISTRKVSEATNVQVEATEETSEVGERSQVVISTRNVSEATNVEVEATEETSAVGESSEVAISTRNISEATNVEVEAMEETSTVGESSRVVISTMNISEVTSVEVEVMEETSVL